MGVTVTDATGVGTNSTSMEFEILPSEGARTFAMPRARPLLSTKQLVGADYGIARDLQLRCELPRGRQLATRGHSSVSNGDLDCSCELFVGRTFAVELQIHRSKLVLSAATEVVLNAG